ncbi:hypothetical protein [Robiginitalea sp. SC105]|uniref:hypothetical protein n=1 Tax=Robiginitalea sp. SC105 TaxID=2762332 RepID=UPI001C8D6030|nr:hypothetical protein [Robiginitalea sp. SC105]
MDPNTSRRYFLNSSFFGLLAVSIPNIQYAHPGHIRRTESVNTADPELSPNYPALDQGTVSEVVGASHFDLDRVKVLVEPRPELARACWDWAFGDFETALGAASHVGRRDIASYLMEKGARPDIFTYAMFGAINAVKAMISETPGIQGIYGPHGISLLSHARTGMREVAGFPVDKARQQQLIDYLQDLGDADPQWPDQPMTEAEKEQYLGDYRYGPGDKDGFSVRKNMREMLSLGRLGAFGGGLYYLGNHAFVYNGTPSVTVTFQMAGERVASLTVEEPGLRLLARKV